MEITTDQLGHKEIPLPYWVNLVNTNYREWKEIFAETRDVPVSGLIPTQENLSTRVILYHIEHFATAFEKLSPFNWVEPDTTLAEIWEVNETLYIIDGHHRAAVCALFALPLHCLYRVFISE